MGLLDFLKPKKPLFDKEAKALFDAMSVLCEDGCETDAIPGASGKFGFDVNNPIPTKTPMGSHCYMARLHSSDGAKVVYNRLGCRYASISSHPIDFYEISHPNGQKLATLFVSAYHKKNSDKAPQGFSLL